LSVADRDATANVDAMRVIDSHVHLYPPEVNNDPLGWAVVHDEPQWAGLCTRIRKNGSSVQAFPSIDQLLREMDRVGVERSVLLGWYWRHPKTCERQNRFYAECIRAHPDRLSAFATIQPQGGSDTTLEEIRRAHGAGLIGLGELSPHSQGYGIGNLAFRSALLLAGELGWAVNVHVTDPNCRPYPGRVETPLEDYIALAREFPAVNFILAHWGGLLALREGAVATLSNVYYDTAASPLMYDDTVWGRVLAKVPRERVLFGSDFPLNLYPKLDAGPNMHRLIDEAKKAGCSSDVLRENAAFLLRLKVRGAA